jgi:hypothetical protein
MNSYRIHTRIAVSRYFLWKTAHEAPSPIASRLPYDFHSDVTASNRYACINRPRSRCAAIAISSRNKKRDRQFLALVAFFVLQFSLSDAPA